MIRAEISSVGLSTLRPKNYRQSLASAGLANLWRDHGDYARFSWKPGTMRPEMIEAAN
jgi:hypothetical protein